MPSFAGTNQERRFTIEGNRLALRPPPGAGGDQRTLTWERVPDLPNLTATHRRLIGFWKLISFERRNAAGELLESNPGQTGFLHYTASGHVMLHLMQPYRRRNVGSAPTPDETMATYRSYASYFGPYTVNEASGVVVHHLDASFNSAAPGADFEHGYDLAGRRLTLKAPVTKDGDGREVHVDDYVGTAQRLIERNAPRRLSASRSMSTCVCASDRKQTSNGDGASAMPCIEQRVEHVRVDLSRTRVDRCSRARLRVRKPRDPEDRPHAAQHGRHRALGKRCPDLAREILAERREPAPAVLFLKNTQGRQPGRQRDWITG